jgi:hypothetical protein
MYRKQMYRAQPSLLCLLLLVLGTAAPLTARTIDFEDISLSPMSFDNGHPDGEGVSERGSILDGGTHSGTHSSGGASLNFNGGFDSFFFWGGWAVSNMTDNTTAGFFNQYSAFNSAIPGAGSGGSANYGVAFSSGSEVPSIVLPAGFSPLSIDLNNTTYSALSMLNGDAFAFPFGGPAPGDEPDQLTATITGNNGAGSIDFLLADYSFADNAQDYVVDQWTTVDISSLAGATELSFSVKTTDIGTFGPNTPLYVAVDNLVVSSPEPTTATLLLSAMLVLLGGSFQRRLVRRDR